MTDSELLLQFAVMIAAITVLLGFSKRFNPSHHSARLQLPWRPLRISILFIGYAFLLLGLAALADQLEGAVNVLAAGAVLIGAIHVVRLLLGSSGSEDDL